VSADGGHGRLLGDRSAAELLESAGRNTDRPDTPVGQQDVPSPIGPSVADPIDEGVPSTRLLVLVGVITFGGLLLRLPSFRDSLFGDEISTYFIVVGHSLGRVLVLVHSNQETTPPLYFVLAWATKGILGSPAQSIRLVSLVAGTAARSRSPSSSG